MPVSRRLRQLKGLLASLLIAVPGLAPAAGAAEVLELRFDGLELPLNLEQLDGWSRTPSGRPGAGAGGDLAVWLDLLDPRSRQDLKILLRAPLLRDTSFGQQLLDSWAGSQMLARLGDLLTASDGSSTTAVLQTTLRRLLETRQDVSTIGLLRALPVQRLSLQLDGLYDLALQWRQQIDLQRQALRRLQTLALPERRTVPFAFGERTSLRARRQGLVVGHRPMPLPLEIWSARDPMGQRGSVAPDRPWLLMMPGLGGNADQFGWLASELAERGWPVVVVQHPGSDGPALKAALDGQRPPPGAETLAIRLADINAVLAAQRRGELPVQGKGVVLLGHSMGGLSALLAAGVVPEPGLGERCRKALDRLPIANPSRLLQCQLPSTQLPERSAPPADLRGLVLLNGFGSLLWPRRGLASLGVPVLMVGGSLDLVTPPLEEQLRLFLQGRDPRSRLVMVEGGSHFSPVRLMATDEVLFRLDAELVGVDPARVQSALLRLTTEYLHTLEQPLLLPAQRRVHQGVTLDVLDAAAARRWKAGLGP